MQPEPVEARVEALAAEFIERGRRGERPDIEDYAARYPDLADAVRQLFPTIAALEAARAKHAGTSRRKPARLARLGDFRILGEIGRGGMGIVYEAVQESLGRRVALKVLSRDTRLDDTDRKRFLREARIAGRLHHTNIVPILGVGEQDGFDFYVMQYIDGIGLDAVIAGLRRENSDRSGASRLSGWRTGDRQPSIVVPLRAPDTHHIEGDTVEDPKSRAAMRIASNRTDSGPSRPPAESPGTFWRDVARVGLQVAQALDYAHAQGTLHRDIKPANLIIDRHQTVWVADFGLAKGIGHEAVSRTGEVLGTLNYMAPEQWQGTADARSDIYSLGVTLYELLTQRLPFQARDRAHGADPRRADGSPVPLQKICPAIPVELETIVMTAIAEQPERRYQTAGELAADFARFLEDRPISVRRPTSWERWKRWRRRNPAAAAFSAMAALLLAMVAVVASAGYLQTRAALKRADDALGREQSERQRAETMLSTSLDTLERVFARLVPESLDQTSARAVAADVNGLPASEPRQAVVSPESAALLEDLLKVYDRLAVEQEGNQQLSRDAARANRRIGEIHVRLGNLDRAEKAFRSSLEKYKRLAEDHSQGGARLEIARLHNELGSIAARRNRPDLARSEYRQALLALPDSANRTAKPEERFELARTEYLIGRGQPVELQSGPPNEPPSDRRHPPAGTFDPSPGAAPPPGAGPPAQRREPDDGFGPPEGPPGGHPPPPPRRAAREPDGGPGAPVATEHIDRAIALLEPLIDEDPKNPAYRYLLARCYREEIRNSSLPIIDAPAKLLLALVAEQPRAADYRYELADLYATMEGAHLRPEEKQAAEGRLRKALEQSTALVEAHPYAADYATLHVHILYRLSRMLADRPPGGPHEPGGPPGRFGDPSPEPDGPGHPGGPRDRHNPSLPERPREHRPDGDDRFDPERHPGPGGRRPGEHRPPPPELGRLEEAAQLIQEALRRQSALIDRFPQNAVHRAWLAKMRLLSAQLALERRLPDEAKALLERAIRDAEADFKAHPNLASLGEVLRDLYRRQAETLRILRRDEMVGGPGKTGRPEPAKSR